MPLPDPPTPPSSPPPPEQPAPSDDVALASLRRAVVEELRMGMGDPAIGLASLVPKLRADLAKVTSAGAKA